MKKHTLRNENAHILISGKQISVLQSRYQMQSDDNKHGATVSGPRAVRRDNARLAHCRLFT